MAEVEKIRKVERSPKGLVNALFDAMDDLNARNITHDEVRAVAHTARAIIGVARLEMDAVRMSESLGRKVEFQSLPGLAERPKQIETTA